MQTPTRVLEATSAHREAVSTVGRFLSECCSVARPGQEFSVDEAATLQQLHRAYIRWDRQQPAPERLQAAMFMQELGRQGYLLTKMWSRSGNESQRYQLIRLAATTEDPPF